MADGVVRRLVALLVLAAAPSYAQTALTHGPWLGHVDADSATVWVRVDTPGEVHLELRAGEPAAVSLVSAEANPEHDLCVTWRLEDLEPSTAYGYQVLTQDGVIVSGAFRTAPAADAPGKTRLAFVSCADEDAGTATGWRALNAANPDALVLLGDTPYIDTTSLADQRRRYGEFAAFQPFADVVRRIPTYATWDDHDFGRDDTDGRLPGKEDSLRAFREYRPNPSYGDGSAGIYTSFRRGPVEVFVLDTRTFAATEPSTHVGHAASLLGAQQWDWLFAGLRASTATYKVLCCGMIWNGAVRPGKRDHWGSYPHERAALFRFVRKHAIEGVVLVGGDIHRSRVLHHELEGVKVFELIVSPLHDRIIEAANAPHEALVADFGRPHAFLLLDADTASVPDDPSLVARLVDASGQPFFEQVVD